MHPILALQHLMEDPGEIGIETNMGSSFSASACIAGLADTGEG